VSLEVEQRYELAALLCEGLRVLDLGDAAEPARRPLASAAAALAADESERFDAVVCLAGDPPPVERLAGLVRNGARLLAAFELPRDRERSPRAQPSASARAQGLAEQLGEAIVLPQFYAQGSLIGLPDGEGAALDLSTGDARPEDAAALIVASGFDSEALSRARASLRVSAEPVLSSYVRRLEAAHEELLRANRRLMSERVGREGSAAASLLNAQRQLEEMKAIARGHEEQMHRVEAWYDAPRYHLVDRVRDFVTRIPGFTRFVRFLWALVSTRAETPKLDAAANPEPGDDDKTELSAVTRDREGREQDDEEGEPREVISRLEQ
jgi:hypothetical protein